MASTGRGKKSYRGGRRGGGNRGGDHDQHEKKPRQDYDEYSPVIIQFRDFQRELDFKHDKHERLVKLSRDITIESKRVIFQLHRCSGSQDRDSIISEAEQKLEDLRQSKWKCVAEELNNEDPYKYHRAYTAGLQEYIEAVSFLYYLKEGSLVSAQQIQKDLVFQIDLNKKSEESADDGATTESDATVGAESEVTSSPSPDTITPSDPESVTIVTAHVPPMDYMLGIADLTGELMRLAIHSVGSGDLDLPFQLCKFIRVIHDAFVSYGNVARELNRKVTVLRQSLHKVEAACYTLQIRGSEIPQHMLAEVLRSVPTGGGTVYDDDGGGLDN